MRALIGTVAAGLAAAAIGIWLNLGATLLTAVPHSVQWSPEKSVAVSVDRADARVGRPATATSVAGAARRAGRRAYRRSYY